MSRAHGVGSSFRYARWDILFLWRIKQDISSSHLLTSNPHRLKLFYTPGHSHWAAMNTRPSVTQPLPVYGPHPLNKSGSDLFFCIVCNVTTTGARERYCCTCGMGFCSDGCFRRHGCSMIRENYESMARLISAIERSAYQHAVTGL